MQRRDYWNQSRFSKMDVFLSASELANYFGKNIKWIQYFGIERQRHECDWTIFDNIPLFFNKLTCNKDMTLHEKATCIKMAIDRSMPVKRN